MAKKYKNGLVLGKLLPPTLGHLFLVDSALTYCDKVYVMVCSTKKDAIRGHLRHQWVTEVYLDNPNVEVIHFENDSPQYPHECESVDVFYKKYWVPHVYSCIKELDVIFTSEDYGYEFASYLGTDHILVDIKREMFPVSGTEVRLNPYKMWDLMSYPAQRYYMKKIAVVGPESTGKSTLTEKLAKYFACDFVDEYGRRYTDKVGTRNLTIRDFELIGMGHARNIRNAKLNQTLIVDTEAITTKVWADMYIGTSQSEILDDLIVNQYFDLFLLMDVDVPWVDDGTREFPHERENHFNRLKVELKSRNLPYVVINGDYGERLRKSIKEVINLGYLY